jgi:hypothetical protein
MPFHAQPRAGIRCRGVFFSNFSNRHRTLWKKIKRRGVDTKTLTRGIYTPPRTHRAPLFRVIVSTPHRCVFFFSRVVCAAKIRKKYAQHHCPCVVSCVFFSIFFARPCALRRGRKSLHTFFSHVVCTPRQVSKILAPSGPYWL